MSGRLRSPSSREGPIRLGLAPPTAQSIRVRAYFHWENRTSEYPDDPVHNWVRAESDALRLWAAEQICTFSAALWVFSVDDVSPRRLLASGSCALVDTGNRRLVLTSNRLAAEMWQPGRLVVLAAGDQTAPVEVSRWTLLDRNDVLGVASLGVPRSFDATRLAREFLMLCEVPIARVERGELAAFVGYRMPVHGTLATSPVPLLGRVSSVDEQHFVIATAETERELDDRGLSLVFARKGDWLVPAGLLPAGRALLSALHVDALQADGTFRA